MDLTGKTIAIIATNYVESSELLYPRDELTRCGATVKVYADKPSRIIGVEGDVHNHQDIPVDGSFDDLVVDTIDALVVPGGTVNADTIRMNEDAREIVHAADEASLPIAAICHGPWLLLSAGVVTDRTLTSYPSLQDDLRNAGAEWIDEEVVRDENIITSRGPDDLPAFVEALCEALVEEE